MEKGKETKKRKLTALVSLAGAFLLPYDKGNQFELEEKQAAELVALGYAEYADVEKAKGKNTENAADKSAASSEKS